MSTSLTNLRHPTRTGFIKLAPHFIEKYGTVIRTGRMQKTATVRCSSYSWFSKTGIWMNVTKNIHVHDEEEFC